MTPRLLLITGPEAGEVASLNPEECLLPDFVVRDYWKALHHIGDPTGYGYSDSEGEVWADHAIRSLPGGEAWLVGLVLPEANRCSTCLNHPSRHGTPGLSTVPKWSCELCRLTAQEPQEAPRLAILAPDPPALLVERVRAWGGDVWFCSQRVNRATEEPTDCLIVCDGFETDIIEDTWPEAVRVALGEVVPS